MKLIPLTQGKFAKVDDKWYDYLMQWKWYAHKNSHTWYASRRCGKDGVLMHILIMGSDKRMPHIDHYDGDGLNNQELNLRFATNSQNSMNRRIMNTGSSKYKGVSWNKGANQWSVSIGKGGVRVNHKYFKIEIEAAFQYDAWARELFGEFARLNFPENKTVK